MPEFFVRGKKYTENETGKVVTIRNLVFSMEDGQRFAVGQLDPTTVITLSEADFPNYTEVTNA